MQTPRLILRNVLLSKCLFKPSAALNYSLKSQEPFANGNTSPFIELLYEEWRQNPAAMQDCWGLFFQNSARGTSGTTATSQMLQSASMSTTGGNPKEIDDHLAVSTVIRSYQSRGHLVAALDPLDIVKVDRSLTSKTEGSPPDNVQKLTDEDMNKEFKLPHFTHIGGSETTLPLKEILRRLELVYCRNIGLEYIHIYNVEESHFIRRLFELPGTLYTLHEEKRLTLQRLAQAHGLETFLQKKFTSEKRFGLEGGDMFIPMIQKFIDVSAAKGVESFIISMAHRGRLNVLANVCKQPFAEIFAQFHTLKPEDEGSGDVKYHLGVTTEIKNEASGRMIKTCVVANPSHLESSGPVCLGKCRAEQFYKGDAEGNKCISLIVHGDSSIAGQGIVYETMHLSYLPNFTTHGAIHFVINNQVGFTTDPRFCRSSRYCTDVGKVVNAPIFHVNGDDPESVIHVARIAAEYRAKYHKDVVIDLVCYRRNGHNEMDQPMFTQPLMYTKIKKTKPVFVKYSQKLIDEGVATEAEVKGYLDEYYKVCDVGLTEAKNKKSMLFKKWLDSKWPGFFKNQPLVYPKTGIPEDDVVHILKKFCAAPGGDFIHHKGLDRMFGHRTTLMDKKKLDFGMAEACAFGSLLKEGIHVRLSGEDVERGTFSHRHHVLHHQNLDGVVYNPLTNLYSGQAIYTVCNSSLSEYGVLGFEHGYSLVNPYALVIWEAQFGDFFNGAQTLIDTYLAAGEAKWIRQNGMVLNLPHGLDGMGPEHSSCRVERFLQMCVDDNLPLGENFAIMQLKHCNWIVVNASTPGNFFHAYRRQIQLPFRKVLINLTPKFLLRHHDAVSDWSEIVGETEFLRMIPERGPASDNPANVKKLMFCSGKVYYEFMALRKEKKLDEQIAISRIEQLSPFPFDLVKTETAKYPEAKIFWVQEEHKNQGPWDYVRPRFRVAINGSRIVKYIGRTAAAAPATGNKYQHLEEIKAMHADFLNA